MSADSKKFKFTQSALKKLDFPMTKTVTYHDAEIAGFKLTLSKAGSYTFIVYRKIKGKPERIKLGNFPAMTVAQARKKAHEVNAIIAKGANPNDSKRGQRDEWTLQQLLQNYLDRHAKVHNKRWRDSESNYQKHLSHWDTHTLSRISYQAIQKLHGQIGEKCGKTQANRIVSLLKVMFNKAILWGEYSKTNQAMGICRYPQKSRTRILQENEMPKLFAALAQEPNHTIRDYILMSLLTGARKSNVLAMAWQDIHISRCKTQGEWLIPQTKNGEPHTIPLVQQSIELLQQRKKVSHSPFVFAGRGKTGHLTSPNKGWQRIVKRAGLKNLRIHDLRRSLGSWQASAGTSLVIIGKTLGHKNINTTAIYAQVGLDPVRKSMQNAITAIFKAAQIQAAEKIPQQSIQLKIDSDILKWLQSKEDAYQTKINQILCAYIDQQKIDK
jgi:integrase